MAWVRVHDGALTHPKIVGIFNPRRPFDLWMWGLSYAQLHLTDGCIPFDAVPKGCIKAVTILVTRGLWCRRDGGAYEIHDFLEWNDDRATVRVRREHAKRRAERFRKRVSHAVTDGAPNALRHALVTGNLTSTSSTSRKALPLDAAAAIPSHALMTKLAHEVFDLHGVEISEADASESLKSRCAQLHVTYDTEAIRKALDAARVQRKRE